RRTQGGNNNAYCQDNEISWFDWSLLEKHPDVHRFVQLLNGRRLLRDAAPERRRSTLHQFLREAKITWHGVKLNQPDWSGHSRTLALTVEAPAEGLVIHLILNAYWEPLEFELPKAENGVPRQWRRWIDTARPSPEDIVDWRLAPVVSGATYQMQPRAVAALF